MGFREVYDGFSVDLAQEWIREGRDENLHLDFKLASAPMTSSDRKKLAIALSGFANADGGLIIWGIDARKNHEGVDCAVALVPISPIAHFLAQLNEFTGDAVNPLVDGVQHRIVETEAGAGLAATLVPASDSGPHMAKAREDRYYKRSGSRFAQMEHFDIEDMFGRRARPSLRVDFRITGGGSTRDMNGVTGAARVILRLENVGRGPARSLYIAAAPSRQVNIRPFGLASGQVDAAIRVISDDASGLMRRFIGSSDFVVQPTVSYDFAEIKVKATRETAEIEDIVLTFGLAADGARMTEQILTVPGSLVLERAKLEIGT